MKLGTQTGSLINHVLSCSKPKDPELGMGCTILSWSDRNPATIIDIFTKGKYTYLTVQDDYAVRKDDLGMSDSQEWTITQNSDGFTRTFRRKDGETQFKGCKQNPLSGRWVNGQGVLIVGQREKYYDFSF
jgi:hypothetical protein